MLKIITENIWLILVVVLGMYSISWELGYRQYQRAKCENIRHKEWHRQEWAKSGWVGREMGAPPPPCSQCLTEVVYYG